MPRTAAQFIQDVSSGEEIFMDVFKAACSWDFETEMQKIVDNSGYDLSPGNLKAAYEAPPNWTLALFGGQYFFTEPSDLKGKSLFVNPTTEQVIMLDDIEQPELQAGKDPTYKFTITPDDSETSQTQTYTITFDVGFKINELPSCHTCRGTRQNDSKVVKATQKIADRDDEDSCKVPDPKDTGNGVNTSIVIGVLLGIDGLAAVALMYAYVVYKSRQGEAAQALLEAEAASPTNEATLREKARKARDTVIEAYSNLRTMLDRPWQARQTVQYFELQEMRHPELNVEYASLQRPVDDKIESYLGTFLADNPKIQPDDLNTKEYESKLGEMREAATLIARGFFKHGATERALVESDRKYSGMAEFLPFNDDVYKNPVAMMGETVADRDFDARDGLLKSYTSIVLDAYIQLEIARLAYERGEAYISAANEASQAAEKARSDIQEKKEAKEKIDKQLEDTAMTSEKMKELTDKSDKLQREIEALEAEVTEQEADKKAADKRKESNKHGERIFTPKK
ncbi:hypothetical protein F5Y14DRAFT_369596 [Nemania sp. NC0429]|nr:hypothetical protein F5Y14DRAFT_369596 [Nemania sp. NC0429]